MSPQLRESPETAKTHDPADPKDPNAPNDPDPPPWAAAKPEIPNSKATRNLRMGLRINRAPTKEVSPPGDFRPTMPVKAENLSASARAGAEFFLPMVPMDKVTVILVIMLIALGGAVFELLAKRAARK